MLAAHARVRAQAGACSRSGPRLHRPARPVRCRSSVETLTSSLLAAERDADVMRVMELVTEARVLHLQLPNEGIEAGIRTFAAGGQWQRAADMLDSLGAAAAPATAEAVFKALADGGQAERALQLLETIEARGGGVSGPTRNLVVRTCAAGGRLERAIELLEAMADAGMKSSMASDDDDPVVPPELRIEAITFAAVASECLKAGLGDKAEEIIEMRDYM